MKYIPFLGILIISFIFLKSNTYYPYQTTYEIEGKLHTVKEASIVEVGPDIIKFEGIYLNKSFRILGKPEQRKGSQCYRIKSGRIIIGKHKITLIFSHTTVIYTI